MFTFRPRFTVSCFLALMSLAGCGAPRALTSLPEEGLRAHQGDAGPGQELEVRAELTPEGFRKLLALGGWSAAKSREDCYFDAFDGHDWVWRRIPDTWKLRIKRKSKGYEFQLRHAIARGGPEPAMLPVSATLWERQEDTPDEAVALRLWNPAIALLSGARSGQVPGAEACRALHGAWIAQRWSGASALQAALRATGGMILPTHTATKVRQEARVTLAHGEAFTVVIGRSTTLDARGVAVERFEVEASPERDTRDVHHAIADVSSWLAARGLKTADIAPAPADVTQAAARVYEGVPGLFPI